MMRLLPILLVFALGQALAQDADYRTYDNEHLTVQFPDTFETNFEVDEDGFFQLIIDGPGTTSVLILISPEPLKLDLEAYSKWMHEELMKSSGLAKDIEREQEAGSMEIGGKTHPSITNHYTGKLFLDRSEFTVSYSIVYGPDHTYLIQEERRNSYISKHEDIVKSIVDSIQFK